MSDWKLVPAYPTQAMDDAGERAVCDSYDSGPSMVAFRAYVAMVEAATEAPPMTDADIEAIFQSVANDDPEVHIRFARAILSAAKGES